VEIVYPACALAAVAVCLGVRWFRKRRMATLPTIIQASLAGAGLAAGVHLGACVFHPAWLVNVMDPAGKPLSEPAIQVSLGGGHAVDVLVGALAVVYVSWTALWSACRGWRG
jgi:hypothetical protein